MRRRVIPFAICMAVFAALVASIYLRRPTKAVWGCPDIRITECNSKVGTWVASCDLNSDEDWVLERRLVYVRATGEVHESEEIKAYKGRLRSPDRDQCEPFTTQSFLNFGAALSGAFTFSIVSTNDDV